MQTARYNHSAPGMTGLLLFLLALVASLVAASPLDSLSSARLHERSSVEGLKTSDQCTYTGHCPTCASTGVKNMVQCCWPRGAGYGSPFDPPGFCICAPAGLYDYKQCNGGFWKS